MSEEVEVLRKKLADLEAEGRFDGRAYPKHMEPFTAVLTGQGFFPGGDGLWRDPDALDRKSPYAFSIGGIMFLGNDFGVQEDFEKRIPYSYENPLTWKRLRRRIEISGVPGSRGFYTNAYLGLRGDGSAIGKRPIKDPKDESSYNKLCADYLKFQIRTQRPRLIVALGVGKKGPAALLGLLIGLPSLRTSEQAQQGVFEGRCLWTLSAWHPASRPDRSEEEGKRLKDAWSKAEHSDLF